MKKLVLTTLLVFMISGIGFASPLMDYSKGSVGFDYTYRPNLSLSGAAEVTGDAAKLLNDNNLPNSLSKDFNGSANLDMGLTVGVGNNWAVQYRQYNPKGTILNQTWDVGSLSSFITGTTNISAIGVNLEGKIRSDEYNVLYKLGKNVAGFVGVVRTSAGITPSLSISSCPNIGIDIPELRSDDRNIFQVGLLGSTKLGDKITGYGNVSLGSNYRNWQAGLAYEFAKEWEFDVNYRYTKFGKYKMGDAFVICPKDGSTLFSTDLNLKDVEAKGWGFGLTYKF